MRHRGTPNTKKQEEKKTIEREDTDEPLDELDQEKLIEQLRAHINKQNNGLEGIFRAICYTAAITSGIYLFWTDMRETEQQDNHPYLRLNRWAHGVMTIYMHWSAFRIISKSPDASFQWSVYVPSFVILVMVATAIMSARRAEAHDSVLLHQGLVLGNLLTIAGGFALRSEIIATDESLKNLIKSKYSHKSL